MVIVWFDDYAQTLNLRLKFIIRHIQFFLHCMQNKSSRFRLWKDIRKMWQTVLGDAGSKQRERLMLLIKYISLHNAKLSILPKLNQIHNVLDNSVSISCAHTTNCHMRGSINLCLSAYTHKDFEKVSGYSKNNFPHSERHPLHVFPENNSWMLLWMETTLQFLLRVWHIKRKSKSSWKRF